MSPSFQKRFSSTPIEITFKNECQSLRIEQNWKWSNKTFPHTLCVVSTSDETTHSGICLTSNKNLYWASGGGVEVWAKIAFFGTIFSMKMGDLLGKYFRKQTNVKNLVT